MSHRPSTNASFCFAVLAFFEMPFGFPVTPLLPDKAGPFSPMSIGVAAPEGLLLPSSKWPSPTFKN